MPPRTSSSARTRTPPRSCSGRSCATAFASSSPARSGGSRAGGSGGADGAPPGGGRGAAHAGMYERAAARQGIAVDPFGTPLSAVDRAIAEGEEEGFVKGPVKKGTARFLGATIVARHAGEMLNELTLAMVGGLGLGTLANVIHPYPTQAEAIRKTADAYNRTRLTPRVKRVFQSWLARSRCHHGGQV